MPSEESVTETSKGVDTSLFSEQGLVENITEEPCTLSGGTETTCYRITTVTAKPSNHQAGHWCPTNLTDTAEAAGIWLEDGKVYDMEDTTTTPIQVVPQKSNNQITMHR